MFSQIRSRRLGAILCASFIGLCGAASSQQPDKVAISGEPKGALGNYVRPGSWFQVVVLASNALDSAQSATLQCTPASGGLSPGFSNVALLPPGSIRRMRMEIYVPPESPDSRSGAQQAAQSQPPIEMTVSLQSESGGKVIKPYLAKKLSPPGRSFCLVRGRIAQEPNDDATFLSPPQQGAKRDDNTYVSPFSDFGRVSIDLTILPDHSAGYSFLTMLILSPSAAISLRPSQVDAILDWVDRGGVLLIPCDSCMPEMLSGTLGAATGAATAGMHRTSQLLISQIKNSGHSQEELHSLVRPLPMAELMPVDAEVRFTANRLPLLLERHVGRGSVFTLAVPVGAMNPSGQNKNDVMKSAWDYIAKACRDIYRPQVDPSKFMTEAADQTLAGQEAIRSIAGRRGPTRTVPLAIIGALVLLTIICGLLVRHYRRGELLWAILLPAGLAVGAGLYVFDRLQTESEQLSYVGLITPTDDGRVRYQQAFAYYSGQDSQTLNFSSAQPDALIRPIRLGRGIGQSQDIRSGAAMTIADQLVNKRSGFGFYVDSISREQSIGTELTFGPDGMIGTLRNPMPADLTDAVIYAGGRTFRLVDRNSNRQNGRIPANGAADVAAGEAQAINYVEYVDVAQPKADADSATGALRQAIPRIVPKIAKGEFTGADVLTRNYVIHNEFIDRLITVSANDVERGNEPLLIAFTTFCPIDPLPGRSMARQGWNAVVWPISFVPPDRKDQPVTIPAGFTNVQISNRGSKTGAWNPRLESFESTRRTGELLVQVRPPGGFGQLHDATGALVVTLRSSQVRLTVGGIKDGNITKDLAVPVASPIDRPDLINRTIEIPDADRFRSPDGTYVFWLKVEYLNKQSVNIEDIVEWSFQRVDAALKGMPK